MVLLLNMLMLQAVVLRVGVVVCWVVALLNFVVSVMFFMMLWYF
jgi:hypothetical protein